MVRNLIKSSCYRRKVCGERVVLDIIRFVVQLILSSVCCLVPCVAVLRLRHKVANYNSESKTTRSRLQTAVDRATKAEEKLADVIAATATNDYDSMERANASGNGLGRRKRSGPQSGSIRSAMNLTPGQGEKAEQIGKVVDAVDSFAVSTGKGIGLAHIDLRLTVF